MLWRAANATSWTFSINSSGPPSRRSSVSWRINPVIRRCARSSGSLKKKGTCGTKNMDCATCMSQRCRLTSRGGPLFATWWKLFLRGPQKTWSPRCLAERFRESLAKNWIGWPGLARLRRISVLAKPLLEDSWMRTALELSKSFKIARPVRLRLCDDPAAMPLTWGFLQPLVVLPSAAADWQEDRRRIVLSHELAHIARNDWFLQVCGELARAVYWFHPLVGVAAERLRQESELACDDSVLNSGIQPSEYANQLLDLARSLQHSGRAWSSALAIARRSNLERRFAAMLNPSVKRHSLSLKSRSLMVLTAFCLLLPLAALRLPAQNMAGKFSGTIHDASGAPITNATVSMTSNKMNIVEMTTSDAAGNFSFKALPAGEYEMKALKRGFEEYKAPQVVLEPGREASQNFTLRVAAVMEEVDVVATGTAKPLPASGTSGKPSRVRVGGDVEAAKRVNLVTPVYPAAAKAAGIQGTVILHAVIGMDGTPLSLRVMNSEIDPELTRSAVEAVSKWRYRPTLLNGQPIEVDTTIMVNFKLLS